MSEKPIASGIEALLGDLRPLLEFFTASRWSERVGDPSINDFVAGNPQELPLPDITDAIQRAIEPKDARSYAYTMSEEQAVETVVESLRERLGVRFEHDDILMTTGAFGGIALALRALVDPGDEVLYMSPPWFFYEPMIRMMGARAVRVDVDPDTFDLDVDAIAAAITERTRAIIVNSPNNPTGRIYSAEILTRLSQVLTDASERRGRPIYLLSDESYSRIVFDGRPFFSPSAFYPRTLLIYTYGKTLLTPGARLGYLAMPASMPQRKAIRNALLLSAIVSGWAFPSAVLQRAVRDLEPLTVDIKRLQARRDLMVDALREAGYELHSPEGTFYLLPRSPWEDDVAFSHLLGQEDTFVLPGSLVELPGYFRISVTANDEMVERGLPVFAGAIQEAAKDPSGPPATTRRARTGAKPGR